MGGLACCGCIERTLPAIFAASIRAKKPVLGSMRTYAAEPHLGMEWVWVKGRNYRPGQRQ